MTRIQKSIGIVTLLLLIDGALYAYHHAPIGLLQALLEGQPEPEIVMVQANGVDDKNALPCLLE